MSSSPPGSSPSPPPRGLQGHRVSMSLGDRSYEAFSPSPLPPDPPLVIDGPRQQLLSRADRALGRLDGVASMLPDRFHFIYQYVRKEALLSSQIEGTQSSLSDLLLYEHDEAPGVPLDDVEEVSQYVKALWEGLRLLREEGLPTSSRLIREVHRVLLSSGRGSQRNPGEFRRQQNWIGGAHPADALFVPPPAHQVADHVTALENFLHGPEGQSLPVLIRIALAHVQLETIHPFLDGNGRVGRLLITLLLCEGEVLQEPLLYLSLYFKRHRARYYELLQACRDRGAWEEWIDFFLEGVRETSQQAFETARKILDLFAIDRRLIDEDLQGVFGRAAGSALRLHELLQQHPVLTAGGAEPYLGLSKPSIYSSFERLRQAGIVAEIPGAGRSKVFVYRSYLELLAEGAEPLDSPSS